MTMFMIVEDRPKAIVLLLYDVAFIGTYAIFKTSLQSALLSFSDSVNTEAGVVIGDFNTTAD